MKFSLPLTSLTVNRSPRFAGEAGKSLIVLFLASLLFFIFSIFYGNVHAQECDTRVTSSQEAINAFNKCAIERNVFDDKLFNTNQIAGTVDSLNTLLTGESRLHPETNVTTANSGALASVGNFVVAMYGSPPASGVQYFADQIHKFNPVQPAYAAEGIGFNALKPVQNVWTVFRNISYIGFVIVFVIIGFMIMFRAHISPQAVATVQDSVPRIVIALVLVTFSYAIAGLMIDLMFVFLNVIINALATFHLIDPNRQNIVFEQSIFKIVTGSWTDIFSKTAHEVGNLINDIVNINHWVDKMVSFFGGGLAALVVGIAVLFVMFRIFFMLLIAYAMIIVLTMAAPFFFLFQALPGRNGAGEWFKQMASQIAVFPTAALMVIFAGILGGLKDISGSSAIPITNQNIGQFPLINGGIGADAIGGLIGIGILMLTPQAAEIVRNALGAKGPQLGGGVGAGLASGAAVVGGGLSRAGQYAGNYANSYNPIAKFGKVRQAKEQEAIQKTAKTGIYNPDYAKIMGGKPPNPNDQ